MIGMTSKNGIDFFPEEFLAMKKQCKKEDDNILIQDDLIDNGVDTMRPINLKQLGTHREEQDQEHENRNDHLILAHQQIVAPQDTAYMNDESLDINQSISGMYGPVIMPNSALPFMQQHANDHENILE